MRPPSCQHDAPDWRLAAKAREPRTLVNTMLQLEETMLPLGIHIVAYRRPARPNGVSENFAQSQPQPFQLRPAQPSGQPTRPYAGAKQALVGVDVAHP